MTVSETAKIIAVMMATYPNYKPSDIQMTVSVWQDMLADYEYQQISVALKAYITSDTSGFAPSVGQLIDKVQTLTKPQELSEMEAWTLVSRALRNGYYGAEEEFNALPPLVQKAVGAPSQLRNWSQTDSDSVENVIQSNFMRTYRTIVQRESQIAKMPSEVRQLIEKVNEDRLQIAPPKPIENVIEDKHEEKTYVPMPDSIKERLDRIKEGHFE